MFFMFSLLFFRLFKFMLSFFYAFKKLFHIFSEYVSVFLFFSQQFSNCGKCAFFCRSSCAISHRNKFWIEGRQMREYLVDQLLFSDFIPRRKKLKTDSWISAHARFKYLSLRDLWLAEWQRQCVPRKILLPGAQSDR